MNIKLIEAPNNTACWRVRREEPTQHLYIYDCSNCGFLVQFSCKPHPSLQAEGYNYCPYCGSRMCATTI